jgi:vesicle transport through interaction with t-SNAREs 1
MSDTGFARYDDEFTLLLQQIQDSLDEEPPNQYTRNLLQCDDLIKQMALEARSVGDASLKRELLHKVRECKQKVTVLQSQSERLGLLSSTSNGGAGLRQNERLLLQKNEDSLAAQNETLERARRTMLETESVALEITEELGANREKLVSSHNRVREMSGLTGRASRILQSMNQRAVQQKMLMYAVAIGLILAFVVMLYTMWR